MKKSGTGIYTTGRDQQHLKVNKPNPVEFMMLDLPKYLHGTANIHSAAQEILRFL
jgi:hypothetical protein